jgi:hypothetical protein
MKFNVTYHISTEESAESGEYESSGYMLEDGTLRDAWEIVRWGCEGGVEANEWPMNNPSWVTFYKVEHDPRTGDTTDYSVHFPRNITPASARRVARLLGVR